MATLTIRNVDPEIRRRLRIRAAEHGRSMEAELREILKDVVGTSPERDKSGLNLAEAIRTRFAPYGGVELEPFPRSLMGSPPEFEK